ncbi:Type I inositol polyphosphate 5-phosphatase 8 [Trichophyton interdigitale]|uniref:Endonuclease/exonuclease/phosphatase n=1 Tax=Trichophyton interdigitale TaxID=101480 RepID=A0A9P4YLD9_9EURO|nr:Endonuclease/exonuclease/phosphatase [Trichophyton interdigitale]KAF3899185.1 Endonuclease/exonuclease/phosphatase [Trichophyton interdigitale]KAG8208639.1 Type I inositol polyphosphate 5-phosphatase 8 [Trichophyton interdigitale]
MAVPKDKAQIDSNTTFNTNVEGLPGTFPDPQLEEPVVVSLNDLSLSAGVRSRKSEYIRQRKLRIRIGSWNVAALSGPEQDLKRWLIPDPVAGGKATENGDNGVGDREDASNEEAAHSVSFKAYGEGPDLYILGLQEIVDVASATEAIKTYVDPGPSAKWNAALQDALPPGYTCIASQQLVGMLLLVYAAPSLEPHISSVSSTSVGTGFLGYTGNKGAVATRIVIGETTRLVFVNSHLAAGAEKANLERRNWDAAQIISRSNFAPIEEQDLISGELNHQFGEEEFSFWFGDLNYRLDGIPGGDVRRLLHLHVQDEFRPAKRNPPLQSIGNSQPEESRKSFESDITSLPSEEGIQMEDNDLDPTEDPASLLNTLSSLLPHDQLQAQQKSGKSFHQGWREGPITFLPTYKYDVGRVGVFDSSEKQRSPSWCDRILFRTKSDHMRHIKKVKEAEEAKKRDEEIRTLGLDKAAEDDNVLFDYDPDQDAADYDPEQDNIAEDAPNNDTTGENAISLLEYTSHQHIVSSDHKPIHADFDVTLDVVIPSLKTKIHQEVARELDKAENEARPDITIVVDQQSEARRSSSGGVVLPTQPDTVHFGKVRYRDPRSRSLTLANTGGVPATFGFHYNPSIDTTGPCSSPPWLNIRVDWPANNSNQDDKSPKEYTFQPGDSANVRLTLCISDIDFVRGLNEGKAKVDDILVLRVTDGRDHFLSIQGDWLPTSFGFSLEELTRIPEDGVRAISVSPAFSGENKTNSRSSGPRELFKLTEAIAEHTERSVAEWGMVSNDTNSESNQAPWEADKRPGWPFDSQTWSLNDIKEREKLLIDVREAIDTNSPFSEHFPPDFPWKYRTELLAETLITFLRSLRDGIITEQLWYALDEQLKLPRDKSKQQESPSSEQMQSSILEILSTSPSHSVSFTFLTFMLNRIANEIAPVTPMPTPSATSPPAKPPSAPTATSSEQPSTPAPAAQTTLLSRQASLSFPFRLRGRNSTLPGNSDANPSLSVPRKNPSVTRREALNDAYASLFASVMFSSSIPLPEKDKDRRLLEERKKGVITPFLYSDTS